MESDYTIPKNILDSVDMAALMTRMAKADWYYDYTEDPAVWNRGRNEINCIKEELLQLCKLENGREVASYLWSSYVPKYSMSRPEFLPEEKNNLSFQKSTPMNEKNFDYLANQLKYTGFGEDLLPQLKGKILTGEKEFTLAHQKDYGKDETVATLYFRRSDENDMVFFNRYNLMLKSQHHPEAIKQTFYIGNNDANITLKEAYNLMSGRAVYKENLTNKEKQEYKAWLQLDFKVTDKNGNFKLHPYNEKYGFYLEKTLGGHSIKELNDPTQKERLIESLQRGNCQSVTMAVQGEDKKLFIEAAPRFKSLNIYDEAGKRLRPEDLRQKNSAEQSVKQDDKKQNQKQSAGGDDNGDTKPGQKKSKRKRQSLS